MSTEPLDINAIENKITPNEPASTCPICLERMDSNYELECGHAFHAKCLVQWFRQKPYCPMCRDPGVRVDERSNIRTLEAMFRLKRELSRRKNAPKLLKRLVASYRKKAARLRQRKKEFREWKRSDEGKEFRRLRDIHSRHWRRSSEWHAMRGHRSLEKQIALYPMIPMIMPIEKLPR